MESVAAIRYATSLFEVGEEENCLEELREELQSLGTVFGENPEFLKLLSAPVLPGEEKLRVLDRIFGGKLSEYMSNFLCLLTERGRMSAFPEIVTEFGRLYNQKNNIQEAEAVTAVALTPELSQKLTEKLEQITGKKILLHNRVDASILGGVVIKMDNSQIDGSVRGRLDALRKQISAIIA